MKTCNACGLTKPAEEFYRNSRQKDGRVGKCRPCYIAIQNRPERQATRRSGVRFKNTGLDSAAQVRLYDRQGGRCGMCTKPITFEGGSLDHNHATGTARGFLCGDCNSGLGLIGDTLEAAERTVAYLKRPPAQSV